MSQGSRTPLMARLARAFRIARFAEEQGIPTREAVDMAREGLTRRRFLTGTAAAAGALALSSTRRAMAGQAPQIDVAVVGAGLAGLSCAYELAGAGVSATVYEASERVGGRCYSLRNFFPGQVAERGGEFIDNLHKTLIGYARTFGLSLEDVTKAPGEVFYYFDGQRVPESAVVDEYRAFVSAMQADLRASSGAPTATLYNEADRILDYTNLSDYLTSRGCGRWAKKAIEEAYVAEYGREPEEQSSLNFLLFIHADKRAKFTPFGVYSDERYHVVEGNDAIATNLAARLPRPIAHGHRLESLRKLSDGRIELGLRVGTRSITARHDAVVLAIPFTVLRSVALDPSLGLPPWKLQAIRELGYGDNAKMMLGFAGPCWAEHGCNGTMYSDLANHQTTWETNPSRATTQQAVLTDYSGGVRGKNLDASRVQTEAARFLADLDRVCPGAQARATRDSRGYLAHLEHWPSNPLTRGSYTCYLPGQFTTLADNEGKPVGNVLFAGEHANSFYIWQGFMEGAALSGIDAAAQVLSL